MEIFSRDIIRENVRKMNSFLKKRFQYKSNFTFLVLDREEPVLYLTASVLNAKTLRGNVIISTSINVPMTICYAYKDIQFLRFLRRSIISLEMHEVDEFIRVDKERIFNPHKDEFDLETFFKEKNCEKDNVLISNVA